MTGSTSGSRRDQSLTEDEQLTEKVRKLVSTKGNVSRSVRVTDRKQASEMEQNGWTIALEASPTRARPSCCPADSVRQLGPGRHIGGDLIDAVVGLVRSSCTVYLNSQFYPQIRSPDFGQSQEWVRNIPRENVQWLLPIHEENHWIALRIDWQSSRIWYYQYGPPQNISMPRSHVDQMDPRQPRSIQPVKRWIRHISGSTQMWSTKEQDGPQPSAHGKSDGAVQVIAMLSRWTTGLEFTFESARPEMWYRHEFLALLDRKFRDQMVSNRGQPSTLDM